MMLLDPAAAAAAAAAGCCHPALPVALIECFTSWPTLRMRNVQPSQLKFDFYESFTEYTITVSNLLMPFIMLPRM